MRFTDGHSDMGARMDAEITKERSELDAAALDGPGRHRKPFRERFDRGLADADASVGPARFHVRQPHGVAANRDVCVEMLREDLAVHARLARLNVANDAR